MKKLYFLFLIIFLYPIYTMAKLPPLTQAQLDTLSNTVVEATVTHNKATSPVEEMGCTKKTPYELKLKVNKTLKGNLATQRITYTGVELKEMCTGPYSPVYSAGTKGTFYLKCDESVCRIIDVRD